MSIFKTLYQWGNSLYYQWILFSSKYLLDSGRLGADVGGNDWNKQVPWDVHQSEVWSLGNYRGLDSACCLMKKVFIKWAHKVSHEGLSVVLAGQPLTHVRYWQFSLDFCKQGRSLCLSQGEEPTIKLAWNLCPNPFTFSLVMLSSVTNMRVFIPWPHPCACDGDY